MEDIGFSMFIGDAVKNTITLFGAGVWSDLLDEQESLDQYTGIAFFFLAFACFFSPKMLSQFSVYCVLGPDRTMGPDMACLLMRLEQR